MTPAPALPSAKAPSRESRLTALWTLYILTLRQHLHGKRWFIMGALLLLPAALAIVVRITEPLAPPLILEFSLAFFFLPQALLPLVALIYSSGIIRDELEEQTFTYLLIRPIPKWAIYTGKLIATITTTTLLTVLFTVLTYAAVYTGNGTPLGDVAVRCSKAAALHSLAMAAYCCLFGLMSLATKRILIAGVIYIALVEGVLANLPFGIRLLTVIYYARLLAHRWIGFTLQMADGSSEDLSGEAWQLQTQTDAALIPHPDNSTALVILATSSALFVAAAAWVCSRREFHVKTPEND